MNRILKFVIIIIASVLVIWFSRDIKNLDEYKSTLKPASFNASDYASKFWSDSLPLSIENAPNILELIQLMRENPKQAFDEYGKKLGISSTYYFMLKGKAEIERIEDEFLILAIDKKAKVKILTDFIYGNALRDGSGKVNIDNFLNMTDFNNVSVAINKLVKEKVASRLKSSAKVGQQLDFAGAIEINEDSFDLIAVSIIPVSVKLSDGTTE